MKFKTALFDFDGVIVDTEPIYDIFWNEAGERYGTGIDNFAAVIKGTTLPYIMEKYFSDRTEEFRRMVINESTEYESTMPLPAMPGSLEFLHLLKKNGVRDGLNSATTEAKSAYLCIWTLFQLPAIGNILHFPQCSRTEKFMAAVPWTTKVLR